MVLWSFAYLALRRVLGLLVLRGKTERAKDLELVVLRHELGILRRQVVGCQNSIRPLTSDLAGS